MKFNFPHSVRPASLEERKSFYEEDFEFSETIKWLERFEPYRMSITFDLGVETGITKDDTPIDLAFIRLGTIAYTQLMETILKYLPEDIYYDRTLYRTPKRCHNCDLRREKGCLECKWADGQELVFDIDPENYWCPNCDVSGKQRIFSFCEKCFKATKEATLYLYEILSESFSDLQAIFTGRGFHIHVLDNDSFYLSISERKQLVSEVKGAGVGIDSWVPLGRMYLIRLPYSLNGLVSRVAIPLQMHEVESLMLNGLSCTPDYIRE